MRKPPTPCRDEPDFLEKLGSIRVACKSAVWRWHFRWSPSYPAPAGRRPQHADRLFSPRPGGDRGSQSLGVVLSGTASDGTLGLQAIKAAGGITFAQEMGTAKFASMPGSAIAAGVVDFVLPPAGIALQLAAIARDSRLRPSFRSDRAAGGCRT